MAVYRLGEGDGWAKGTIRRRHAVRQTVAAVRKDGLPARLRWPWRDDFGPKLQGARLRLRLGRGLLRCQRGDVVVAVATSGTRHRIRKEQADRGNQVVRAALSQLGVPYVWADADPAGGGSAGFDCSGLTLWCYQQVGIELPHLADGQLHDAQVTVFSDRGKVKPGDLIFYHVGRLAIGHADHVGIAGGGGTVIDASSGLDRVVHRDMDANPVMSYGRVEAVNGAL